MVAALLGGGSRRVAGRFLPAVRAQLVDGSLSFKHACEYDGGEIEHDLGSMTYTGIAPDGAAHDGFVETPAARMTTRHHPGTRWPAGGELSIDTDSGPLMVTFEPVQRFQMRGLGYTCPR